MRRDHRESTREYRGEDQVCVAYEASAALAQHGVREGSASTKTGRDVEAEGGASAQVHAHRSNNTRGSEILPASPWDTATIKSIDGDLFHAHQ